MLHSWDVVLNAGESWKHDLADDIVYLSDGQEHQSIRAAIGSKHARAKKFAHEQIVSVAGPIMDKLERIEGNRKLQHLFNRGEAESHFRKPATVSEPKKGGEGVPGERLDDETPDTETKKGQEQRRDSGKNQGDSVCLSDAFELKSLLEQRKWNVT